MRHVGWIAFIVICSMLATAPTSHAQKRVALVIGNSAYEHTVQLANPKNDATDMATSLRSHGFQVIEGLDLNKPAFDRRVRDFVSLLKGADVGVFFYAGHGLQVASRNYLVPIDAKADEVATIDLEMVRVDVIQRIMELQTNTNILFLDACRDNPLVRNLARSMGTRSSDVGHGLAPLESAVGTLISFSTQPGNVALDGVGRNSPFAAALVKHLGAPKDLSAILIDVRNDVMRETKDKQVPWEHSALRGQFRFNPSAAAGSEGAAFAAQSRPSEAERAWAAVRDNTSIAVLEVVATRYNGTVYADLARARIEELKRGQGNNTDDEARAKVEAELLKLQQATPAHSRYLAPVEPRAALSGQNQERDRIEGELAHKRFSRSTMVTLSCDILWYLRNSIFARYGYRFTTPRARQTFGAGGWTDNPQLSEIEQHNVNEIRAAEAMNRCPA